jgi:PIN domain nuclease of toxin-antitoxin system
MIILDTHIRVWWVHGDARLSEKQVKWLEENETSGLGINTKITR